MDKIDNTTAIKTSWIGLASGTPKFHMITRINHNKNIF